MASVTEPHRDNRGIEILLTDTVRITSWGIGARLIDTGILSPVHRFTPTRVEITDSDGQLRTVGPSCVLVMRRDGVDGFETNREQD